MQWIGQNTPSPKHVKGIPQFLWPILSIEPLFYGLVPILPTWAASGGLEGTFGTLNYQQTGKIGPPAGLWGGRGLGEVGGTGSVDPVDLLTV